MEFLAAVGAEGGLGRFADVEDDALATKALSDAAAASPAAAPPSVSSSSLSSRRMGVALFVPKP